MTLLYNKIKMILLDAIGVIYVTLLLIYRMLVCRAWVESGIRLLRRHGIGIS